VAYNIQSSLGRAWEEYLSIWTGILL
jgi:hypothetical protein